MHRLRHGAVLMPIPCAICVSTGSSAIGGDAVVNGLAWTI